jgi:flagellar hook-basal body complex protein FliE
MGFVVGRTSLAIAAITDVALALALVNALEETEQTKSAAQVLSAKTEKLKKRQAEAKAHQRNLRKGKKK